MAIPLERARAIVLAAAAPLPLEDVPIAGAAGRVLAGELRAALDSPADTNSAMDGFAVTAGPAGRTLRLVGESRAGAPSPAVVGPGTTVRIATGAVLPRGAEAVVPLEQASLAGAEVTVSAAVARGRHVRPAGEDMRAGEIVLPGGTRLGAAELSVAIGAGHGRLACHRRPRVVLLGTGDELRDPGSTLPAGGVHDSNTIALAALAADAGAEVVRRGRIPDRPADTRDELARALAEADLVVITGGISAGPHDHVKPALAALGFDERFWGVELRPGRPTWFGRRDDTLALGLPGNPVAAIVTFVLLARPVLLALHGRTVLPVRERACLVRPVRPHPARTEVLFVRVGTADGHVLRATPAPPRGSNVTTAMLGADGLAVIPPGREELPAGAAVEIERWAP